MMNSDNEISEYMCVERSSSLALSMAINEMMADGWVPFGGVSSTMFISGNCDDRNAYLQLFSQAVIKYR